MLYSELFFRKSSLLHHYFISVEPTGTCANDHAPTGAGAVDFLKRPSLLISGAGAGVGVGGGGGGEEAWSSG